MNKFLKHYSMRIVALSPIHIGSGVLIGKKEYINLPWKHKIVIPDIEKMYETLRKKGKERAFQMYMLKNDREDLGVWLKQEGFREADYLAWKAYELDSGEAFLAPKGRAQRPVKEINAFVKDPYGMPYVPGSSIKGMLRTALLIYEVKHNKKMYESQLEDIEQNAAYGKNRKQCLAKETARLEAKVFCKNRLNEDKLDDMVNSIMAGLIVSDSKPIGLDQLTLCQKIDYTLDGTEKALPMLREVLIPGTQIDFELTIDTDRFPYSIEEIFQALNEYQKDCYLNFYQRFRRGTVDSDCVWLGGGAGYVAKTVLYSLYGKSAVRIIDQIFKTTLGRQYSEHKHEKDLSLRLAPHVCKCTRYQGELYDMGLGKIQILESN